MAESDSGPSKEAKQHAAKVVRALARDYADAECALRFDSPVQLLVATILSAQCTDERVNIVTEKLFAKHPTAEDLANIPAKRLEKLIESTGFFRNKAKNIKAACQTIVDEHGGEIPRDLDSLVALPGVGRKTANVVLGNAFGIASGFVVDTHVKRISRLLGLTKKTNPDQIERDLTRLLPKSSWIETPHRLIFLGREICIARRPQCPQCPLLKCCDRTGLPPLN